jgi:formate dehydrogenase beta subunit
VWDRKVVDTRKLQYFEVDETSGFEHFEEFDPGNRIRAFFGGKGFFAFDRDVDLLDGLRQYLSRAASESCGKCTPCRVGLQILKGKLDDLVAGVAGPESFELIRTLAEQVRDTSLCGLGQTATVALLEILKAFPDELTRRIGRMGEEKQSSTTYVTSPCIEACPAKVEVPEYIDYIKEGALSHSVGVILKKYPMAATCGRVCVRFCEMACRRTQVDQAVGIKLLKRFVADKERYVTDRWFSPDLIKNKKPAQLRVAVIGAGPAGIAAAYHLLLRGYQVDVFEAMTEPGGMAAVGIPEYRLPKATPRQECSIIESLGGRIIYNKRMGQDYSLEELFKQGYKAVFLGIGAHKGKPLDVPGEDRSVQGYLSGVRFLLYINHYFIGLGLPVDMGKSLVVVGGGNVAMDCARSALRLGVKEVHLVYRRTKDEMPADHEEVEAAEAEGITFHYLSHPTRIVTEGGKVTGVELIKMRLGEPDAKGRKTVHPDEGTNWLLQTDNVVVAIGQEVDNRFLKGDEGIKINRYGLIEVNEDTRMTTRKGVFAGGDAVSGPATLIEAMSQGEKAAAAMDDYLDHGWVRFNPKNRMSQLLEQLKDIDEMGIRAPVHVEYRVTARELDPKVRKDLFEEVEKPITQEEAYREANRCMRCYRVYSVVTER